MDIFTAPTISPNRFAEIMGRYPNSPILKERPASEYYAVPIRYGIDPNFVLMLGVVEHQLATAKDSVVVRLGIKNWGDCRTKRNPKLGGKSVTDPPPNDRGNFWAYPTWLDSLDDLCYRLVEPEYDYQRKGVRTVEAALPILAPKKDRDNDPEAYIKSAIRLMTEWSDIKGGNVTGDPTGILTGTIRAPIVIAKPAMTIDHTPSKFGGYGKGVRQQRMIVDHITAASKARYNEDTPSLGWLRDPHIDPATGDDISPSVNYLIGRSGKIVEIVPPDGPAPWTNGISYAQYPSGKRPNMDNPIIAEITRAQISPNQVCITIEHESENGGDITPAQWIASIGLHIWLCSRFNITPDATHIVGHNQWDSIDRLYCPGWTPAQWNTLRSSVAQGLAGGLVVKATEVTGGKTAMSIPKVGVTEAQVIDGQIVVVTNYGPPERDIVSADVNTVDQNVVGVNKRGDRYGRSQINNVVNPFYVIGKKP